MYTLLMSNSVLPIAMLMVSSSSTTRHTHVLQTPSLQTSFSTHTHNMPKGKIHSTSKLLPKHRRHKIEHRNNIRAQNASDPSISELNSEITTPIQTHKSDIWREHLDTHWDHKHNTHTLWKTIHGLANKKPTPPKQHHNFQRENIHLTHTDRKPI